VISALLGLSLGTFGCAAPLSRPPEELLILTPADLAPAAEELASFRREDGLRVRVEPVDGLALEGALSPDRVKARVRETWSEVGEGLRYLLLLGDAPVPGDPGGRVRIPPRLLPASYVDERWPHAEELASDVWYGMLDGDRVPELAVGRLPVDNLREARRMVERIIAYEESTDFGSWRKRIEVVAGVAGFGALEDALIEKVARRYLGELIDPAYDVTVTWANPSSPYSHLPSRFSEKVLERLNAGSLIATYIGHGKPFGFGKVEWEGKRHPIFRLGEARRIAVEHGAPLMVLLACSTGWFDHEKGDCISEVLLERPRGPIAVFSSTRVSQPYADGIIGRELIANLMSPEHERLGDSIRAVQAALVNPEGEEQALLDGLAGMIMKPETLAACREDHVHLYALFGDPSMKLGLPRGAVELRAPRTATAGEAIEVSGTLDREYRGRAVVTLEVRRGHSRAEQLRTAGFTGRPLEKTMAENWRRANDLVIAREELLVESRSFTVPLLPPLDGLPVGELLLRVFVEDPQGCAVAAVPIRIEAPAGSLLMQEAVRQVAFRSARRDAARRHRRIIFNNDGNEPVYFMDEATPESLLALRTAPLADSQVDTIFYCTWSSGFGYFTHDTKIGTPFTRTEDKLSNNKTAELHAKGLDPLEIVVDWCKANDVEVFWSFRMNDTHDASSAWYGPLLFPPLKEEHPEWLVGTRAKRPPNGRWTAVDFTRPGVRELAFRYIEEVCRNYDVDGVELDFFRHLNYFKGVSWGEPATEEELEMMTGLLRRVREMTEEVGWERGRPILVAVRVPDCIEFCRTLGFDVPRWLREDLVDLMTVSGYFRLEKWKWSVALGHDHRVPVYACLSESRQRDAEVKAVYTSQEGYRARAMNAWYSGVDGIYLFNAFDPTSPLWRELGDPSALKQLSKVYFTSARGYGNVDSWWEGGSKWMRRSILSPDRPRRLTADRPEVVELLVGEDPDTAAARMLRLRFKGLPEVEAVRVEVNGESPGPLRLEGTWLVGELPRGVVREGWNEIAVTLEAGVEPSVSWLDLHFRVER